VDQIPSALPCPGQPGTVRPGPSNNNWMASIHKKSQFVRSGANYFLFADRSPRTHASIRAIPAWIPPSAKSWRMNGPTRAAGLPNGRAAASNDEGHGAAAALCWNSCRFSSIEGRDLVRGGQCAMVTRRARLRLKGFLQHLRHNEGPENRRGTFQHPLHFQKSLANCFTASCGSQDVVDVLVYEFYGGTDGCAFDAGVAQVFASSEHPGSAVLPTGVESRGRLPSNLPRDCRKLRCRSSAASTAVEIVEMPWLYTGLNAHTASPSTIKRSGHDFRRS